MEDHESIFKQKSPDVIYTSSPDLFVAFFALLFGKRYKIPVVVEIRDLWPESIVEYNGMSRKIRLYRFCISWKNGYISKQIN